jgi:hypothetical protein
LGPSTALLTVNIQPVISAIAFKLSLQRRKAIFIKRRYLVAVES